MKRPLHLELVWTQQVKVTQKMLMTSNFPPAEIKFYYLVLNQSLRRVRGQHFWLKVRKIFSAIFLSLPSTQVADLKVVVDRKDIPLAPTVQKAERGEKGDKGEPGLRGPSGLDVSRLMLQVKKLDSDPR